MLFVSSFLRESCSYMYQTDCLNNSLLCACIFPIYVQLVADKEHHRVMFTIMYSQTSIKRSPLLTGRGHHLEFPIG